MKILMHDQSSNMHVLPYINTLNNQKHPAINCQTIKKKQAKTAMKKRKKQNRKQKTMFILSLRNEYRPSLRMKSTIVETFCINLSPTVGKKSIFFSHTQTLISLIRVSASLTLESEEITYLIATYIPRGSSIDKLVEKILS